MTSTTSAWGTEITTVIESGYTLTTPCDILNSTLSFLVLVIALVGLAGNGIVLWLLGFHMHRNAFTVYVLNLAGADFLFLCFQTVYSLKGIIDIFHPVSKDKHIPDLILTMFTFTYLTSLSMLSAISAERCLSVLWPIWYRCRRPRHTSAVMCTLLWALCLLFSLLEGKGCGFLFNRFDDVWCRIFDFITTPWLVVLFVVLSGFSLVLLVRIFLSSWKMHVTKLYVTVSLSVLVYLLFGLPFGIEWFILTWLESFHFAFPCKFYEMTVFLSSINSCANPIIYFFVGSFRRHRLQRRRPYTLKLILQRAMQDIPEEEEGGDGSS